MSRTSHDSLAGQVLADVELGNGDLVRLADLHIKLGPQLGDIAQKLIDRTAAGRDAAGPTSAERSVVSAVRWSNGWPRGSPD